MCNASPLSAAASARLLASPRLQVWLGRGHSRRRRLLRLPLLLRLRRRVQHAFNLLPPPLRELPQLLLRAGRPLHLGGSLAGRRGGIVGHAGPRRVGARALVLALQQWLTKRIRALAVQVAGPAAQAAGRERGRI